MRKGSGMMRAAGGGADHARSRARTRRRRKERAGSNHARETTHVGLDMAHRVEHGEARGDRTARRVNVHGDRLVVVLRIEVQHDADHLVGNVIGDLLAEKEDALAVQAIVQVDPIGRVGPRDLVGHLRTAGRGRGGERKSASSGQMGRRCILSQKRSAITRTHLGHADRHLDAGGAGRRERHAGRSAGQRRREAAHARGHQQQRRHFRSDALSSRRFFSAAAAWFRWPSKPAACRKPILTLFPLGRFGYRRDRRSQRQHKGRFLPAQGQAATELSADGRRRVRPERPCRSALLLRRPLDALP